MDEKSEKMYLTLFINGLNTQICQLVTMQRPHSYEQAKILALSVDASFNVLKIINMKEEETIIVTIKQITIEIIIIMAIKIIITTIILQQ
jgi:hypothetical protein